MRNKRVQDKILSLIFILVLFNTVFARKISFFNYFDEVITIISLMYLICNYNQFLDHSYLKLKLNIFLISNPTV